MRCRPKKNDTHQEKNEFVDCLKEEENIIEKTYRGG
jgi:hypothetical protein